jgi:hypothetical protein
MPLVRIQPYLQLVLISLLGIAQAGIGNSLWKLGPAPSVRAERMPLRWEPDFFRFLSFGQIALASHWFWLRAMTDGEMTRLPKGQHSQLLYDLQLSTDLDPAFLDGYLYGGNLVVVVRDDGEGGRQLYEKGMAFLQNKLPSQSVYLKDKVWRNAWGLAVSLAYVQLFELDNLPAAAEAFIEASRHPGAPIYIGSLADRLRKPGGRYEVGLRLIQFMLLSAPDERGKEKLEAKRRSLFLSQSLYFLNQRFAAYLVSRFPGLESVPREKREGEFRRFLAEAAELESEPFGGTWILTPEGRIDSTTPREKVFGLD